MNVTTTVHSISHRADETDTPHLRTRTPSHKFSFPVPLPVVLTHVLALLDPIWLLLISRCPLVALVLVPPAPPCYCSSHGVHWLLLFSHPWLLSCYCSSHGVSWLLLFSPLFLHPHLLSCYCSSHGVSWLLLFSHLFLHPWLLSCNACLLSVRALLQSPHYRIGTPCYLIKSLGLILQLALLLLLLMVLTQDVDYVDSKN
jgi:hypothetical protein